MGFHGGFGAERSHHGLCQGLLNERDAALVDWLTVGQEADLEGCGNRRQALEKRAKAALRRAYKDGERVDEKPPEGFRLLHNC